MVLNFQIQIFNTIWKVSDGTKHRYFKNLYQKTPRLNGIKIAKIKILYHLEIPDSKIQDLLPF